MSETKTKQVEVLKYKDSGSEDHAPGRQVPLYAYWNYHYDDFQEVGDIFDADHFEPGKATQLLEDMDEEYRIWEVVPIEVSITIKK